MSTRAPALLAALLLAACSSSVVGEFPATLVVPESSPDEVDAVVFLLGDAGGTAEDRSPVLEQLSADVERWSAALGRDSAVSVAYLGDIVYPDGVHNRGHPDFARDSIRLWNQINVVTGPNAREHATLGLFLAGNHDWGNMTGEAAVARAMNLRTALESARSSTGARVSLLPNVEDPGPVIRDLRQNVRLMFIDTHWWLQERSSVAKDAFFTRVEEGIEGAGDREVIILSHHPWASAGPHGVVASGSRAIGTLFLLSKSGTYVQDVNSPAYDDFRSRLRSAFERSGRLPLVYAAGHDHSLQVLTGRNPGDPRHILVSGSGSKLSSIEDTTGLRHAAVRPGYMTLVFRRDDAVDLFVNAGSPAHLDCPEDEEAGRACMREAADSFAVVFSDRLLSAAEADGDSTALPAEQATGDNLDSEEAEALEEAEAPPAAIDPTEISIYADSIVATPGLSYSAGVIQRFMLGDLNRDLWDLPFKVAVLNLDAVGGSLEPDELSGGKQTLGLKFDGADGRKYQFRSIVKNAGRALPTALRSGPIDDAFQDQMAAQFPLSAMVVAELLEAAGILVAKPRPVVMPDDPRLGEYRELFAGRMGWIEERPNEVGDDDPGFAGSSKITGTDELYEELREEPKAYIDDEALLVARLIDLFVGDWDRHYGNWRWASFDDGDRTRWEAIPRDRDWALASIDGVIPSIVRIYYPKYVGFGSEYPSIKRLTWAAQNFDRRLLNQMTRQDFERAAAQLQRAYTDSVIERAVGVLPEPYLEAIGDRLVGDLKSRRNTLGEAASEFYELLASWVDVQGTDESDHVMIRRGANRSVRVEIKSGEEGFTTFERTFLADETDEVRIYLLDGDDVVEFDGDSDLPIRFKIIGGDGDDLVVARNHENRRVSGRGFSLWNADILDQDPVPVDVSNLDEDEAAERRLAGERPTIVWDRRDWGHEWIPTPSLDYASEFGLHLGATVTRRGFGFGHEPYSNQLTVNALGAASPRRLVLRGEYEHALGSTGLYLQVEGRWLTQRLSRFYGFGNETTNDLAEERYETRRSLRNVEALLTYRPETENWSVWAGPRVRRWGRTDANSTVFDLFPALGSEATTLVGGVVGARRDSRDDADDPRAGSLLTAEFAAYPALADIDDPWGGVSMQARRYLSTERIPGEPALHLGITAESVSPDAPYFERASLGGGSSLPGLRSGRFRGDHAASALALLRTRVVSTRVAGGIDLGLHGVAALGRVWLAGEDSETLHSGAGGGIWLRSGSLDKLFSVTVASAEGGPRTYLNLGFPF